MRLRWGKMTASQTIAINKSIDIAIMVTSLRLRLQGSMAVKPSHPLHQLRDSHREPFGEPADVDQARLAVTILEVADVLSAQPGALT